MRTQVGIVGAGPAGLMLAQLLQLQGIEAVVLEARSREHVEQRIRAGVLEQGTVDLLDAAGVGERMRREGLVHHGVELQFDGERHRIPLSELAGGRTIVVYGQTEVVKDLIAARLASGAPLLFEVGGGERARARLRATRSSATSTTAGRAGARVRLHRRLRRLPRRLPRDHPRGGAAHVRARLSRSAGSASWPQSRPRARSSSTRTTSAASRCTACARPELSRLYIQCRPDEDIGEWPDERIWEELQLRLGLDGWTLAEGPVLEKGVTGMRSFVTEPMRYGRLYLAGDAAHIVPPTGAKGLNLAIADVRILAEALASWHATGSQALLDAYSETCLRRVWRAEHFSWWMTSMLHRSPDGDPFEQKLQLSQLRHVVSSRAAATVLAENYVGLAF